MPLATRKLALGCFALLVALAGCNTDEGSGSHDFAVQGHDGGKKRDGSTDDAGPSVDLACIPEVTSCTGLCGPVHDDCTGQSFQCGACASGTVCDLDSHTCIAPKATCAAEGGVCGSTKNSCGTTVLCTPFDCPMATQQCDPNTNQCVACQQVSCADLGYECGSAWLGCGDRTITSNITNCGGCASNQVCNPSTHICDQQAGGVCGLPGTPQQNAQAWCDAAKKSDGVQCGLIPNGCGGLVDCTATDSADYTCPTGTTCGGSGIPNVCGASEVPTECITAGYNCGYLASACGGNVTCGTCSGDPTMVGCIKGSQTATAGVCGTLCNMPHKSCKSDYANQCGKGLNDNCWPDTIECDCASGVCSTESTPGVVGTCGAQEQCKQYTTQGPGQPCSDGPSSAFPAGDGTDLPCPCTNTGPGQGQQVCNGIGSNGAGVCCQRPTCPTDGSKASIPDTCNNNQPISCCTGNEIPYNGACCTPTYQCPPDGEYHSTNNASTCGQTVVCHCNRAGVGLDDPKNPTDGEACCAKPTCVTGSCANQTSSCSGNTITCGVGNCPAMANEECDPTNNMCCNATHTCTSGVYSTGVDACHVPYTCNCTGGTLTPKNTSGQPVSGQACCQPPAKCSATNDCSGDTKNANCGTDTGGVDPYTTGHNNCSPTDCGNTSCCSGGTCVPQNVCPTNSCTPIANACPGQPNIPCNCPLGGEVCSGNMCSCPPATCNGCNPTTQQNACGSIVNCGCSGSQICGNSNACCTPQTCAQGLPAGHECGSFTDSCTGTTQCTAVCSVNKLNGTCNLTTGQCECVPEKCCKDTGGVTPCLPPGPYQDDRCGNAGTCAS